MAAASRGWADVLSFELDPGMGRLVPALGREPDDELRRVALLPKQAKEDK
jgi:hypothetical protein